MKASARKIIAQASREPSWVPEYAKGNQELWTPPLVKKALVDAFRMLRRVGGRVGPADLKAFWPEYRLDQGDYVEQAISGTLKQNRPPAASYETRITVTKMEACLLGWTDDDWKTHPAWLAGPLLDLPREREKLVAWIQAELRGENFKDLCERKRWALSSAKRHRDTAAGIIAHRLNSAKVEVW